MQLPLGHIKLESTVRYLGIEVEDALELSEQTDILTALTRRVTNADLTYSYQPLANVCRWPGLVRALDPLLTRRSTE